MDDQLYNRILWSAGIRHLRNFNASQKEGLLAAVSDRALIIAAAFDESFAHEGTSPQRTSDSSRLALIGFCLMTGTNCVGAIL